MSRIMIICYDNNLIWRNKEGLKMNNKPINYSNAEQLNETCFPSSKLLIPGHEEYDIRTGTGKL